MFHDLTQLFLSADLPSDDTDCLSQVAELIRELGPSLLILVNHQGTLLAADPVGLAAHGEEAARLAASLEQALRTQKINFFEFPSKLGRRAAFGVRLSPATVGAMLGGLVTAEESHLQKLAKKASELAICGDLAWRAVTGQASLLRMKARKDQIRTEYDTLRLAFGKAQAVALEEHQKRVEAEQQYSQRLEKEVERRSAELRTALDDATEKSRELEEYSQALESTNRTLEEFIRAANAANQAKSLFLATISHEIRTPMTAILGHADLAFDELGNAAACRPSLEAIQRSGQHLLEILNNILDLTKVEAGKLEISLGRFQLQPLVDEVRQLMEVRGRAKGLAVIAEYGVALPRIIETDSTRLKQILLNLVGNAIKFTETGEVRLAVRCEEGVDGQLALQFEVSDTGPGIPADKLDFVFEPFTQADGSITRQFGGTGLGLTISRQLARLLGGDISVKSEIGKGSTFRVFLPLAASELGETSSRDSAFSSETGQSFSGSLSCRILVADDCADNRRIIQVMLNRAGGEVICVENGKAAVDAIFAVDSPHCAGATTDDSFDLVLMDMQMPVLDGYGAARLLRKMGFRKPILALTANAILGEREKCIEAGCDDYLTKPIDRNKLLSFVSRYAEQGMVARP